MIRDATDLPPGAELSADLCIVGAGPAGITLARDLRGAGLKILMLETGGFAPEVPAQALCKGSNKGLPYTGLEACRVRVFGGASNHWGGWCRPLDPEDLASWPLDASELQGWYVAAHRSCQLGAMDYDAHGYARRLGAPLPALDPDLARYVAYQLSPPTRFGPLYRPDLEQAEDITVMLHATALKVESQSGVATTLSVGTLAGARFRVRAERYVLALGGIDNARMLLLSGLGGPWVGKGFAEHPHYPEGALVLLDPKVDARPFVPQEVVSYDADHPDGKDAWAMAALTLPPAVRKREGLPNGAATLEPIRVGSLEEAQATGAMRSATVSALLRGRGRLHRLILRGQQGLSSDSRVTLSTHDSDALGMARVDLHWSIPAEDTRGHARTLELLAGALGAAGFGRVFMPRDAAGRWSPPAPEGGCHHMGTTRMAAKASDGVVDGRLAMHGLSNVYMLGSSVFPTVGYANPTLTIVALAHRLAAHLRGPA